MKVCGMSTVICFCYKLALKVINVKSYLVLYLSKKKFNSNKLILILELLHINYTSLL